MGLGLFGDAETIKIEHIFTFNLGDKWERPLRKSMGQWMDLCMEYAESFRFIAVGIGSYFFLLGVSKVLEAGNYPRNDDGGTGGTVRKSSTKSGVGGSSDKKRSGSSDNASVRSSRTNRSLKKKSHPAFASDVAIPTSIITRNDDVNGGDVGLNSLPLPATIPEESEAPSTDDGHQEEAASGTLTGQSQC
jgi:hypothetical protein